MWEKGVGDVLSGFEINWSWQLPQLHCPALDGRDIVLQRHASHTGWGSALKDRAKDVRELTEAHLYTQIAPVHLCRTAWTCRTR